MMKRWIAAGAAAAAGVAIALTGVPANPLAPVEGIAAGLRSLSMSGAAGNALAWALWAALSLLPLLGLLPAGRKRGLADVFFTLSALLSLPMWYCFANPGLLAARFPGGSEMLLPVARMLLLAPVLLLLSGAVMLRCTEGDARRDGARTFLRRTRVLLAAFLCIEAGAAAYAMAGGLRSAAGEGGLTVALAAFQALCILAVCAAALATLSAAMDLARAMENGWFAAEREAVRLAHLARLQLAVTCGAAALSAAACAALMGRVSMAAVTDIPLTELLAALACMLLARFVAEGARLKRENDEFV